MLVVAVAAVAAAAGVKNSDNLSLPGTDSTSAQDLLQDHLPSQAYGTNPVVLETDSGKLTDSKNKKAVEDTVDSLRKQDDVTRAVSPLGAAGKAALSKDKKIGVRCLAVPAVMALMGRAAGWMPRWMARLLPPISIEGGDFFERRDAERRLEPATREAT